VGKNLQFSNSWAIILGGSSGFGFAAIKKLTQHGMNIAVLYREPSLTEKKLKADLLAIETETGATILPYNINALEKTGRDSFISQFKAAGGPDKKCAVKLMLHSIARGNLKPLATTESGSSQPFEVLSAEDLQYTTYAMSNSLLDWARLILDEELFDEDARIIGLTSEGAHKFWDGYAAVSIAKASLESLAKYMAVEFSPYGLKTNLIQAGITDTLSLKKNTW